MQPIRVYAGFDTGETLEERAAIMEFEAGLSRFDAERESGLAAWENTVINQSAKGITTP